MRDSEPRPSTGDVSADATAIIEGPTAEQAIARVHAEHGPDARIVDARRARRGGIAGFFTSEVVQLHVASASTSAPAGDAGASVSVSPRGEDVPAPGSARDADVPAPVPTRDAVTPGSVPTAVPSSGPTAAGRSAPTSGPTSGPTGAAGPTASASPVDRLVAGADAMPETMDFATFLQRQLHADAATHPVRSHADASPPHIQDFWRTAAAGAAMRDDVAGGREPAATRTLLVEEPVPDPTTVEPPAPDPSPGPAWSGTSLLQLGLPVDLVRAVEPELRGTDDDVAWTMAMARAVTPALGPIPPGPALLVGPRADRLSAAVAAPTARSRMWFEALQEGRWIHLVVGGDGWRDLLTCGPRVLSWATPRDLPDALRCAFELDLTLGYGIQDGVARRARPLDVALAIRALVEQR